MELDHSNRKHENDFPIIDCDVHEMLTSLRDLFPYLKEPWISYITKGMWQPNGLPYAWPLDGGVDRLDAKLEGGQPAGSSYEVFREQVLEQYNIKYAILTSLFFPSDLPTQFEFATALASAYNDWLIENWLSKDERLRGSICVAAQDPISAAKEIDRVAGHPQMVQVMLPVITKGYGDPFYHPIFEAAERNNLVIAMHQSSQTRSALGLPKYYIEWHVTMPQNFMCQVVSLISHGVFDKYPSLKVIMLEGGFTWVPHLMWRFDQNYRSLRREVPWLKRLPSEYIRDHFKFSTQPIEDPDPKHLLQMVEMMGSDKMLVFSTDYPHWDFDDPLRAYPHTFSKELKRKILFDNAQELYHF